MRLCLIILNIFANAHSFYLCKSGSLRETNGGLYLAINPLAFVDDDGNTVKRRLEVNWYGEEVKEDDIIELESPVYGNNILAPFDFSDGFYIYPDNLPYPTLDEMGFTRTCVFGYKVTWKRADDSIVANSCLQSEPSWMWDHKNEIEYMNIGDMMLIGTHDAGAYRDYQGVGDNNWATSSVFAQEEDLLHQLIWGVRFLDIRAGFYPTTEERFWMVHAIIKTHPMMEGIEDVKTFLKNTNEIVIWEINNFNQIWDPSTHEEFKALLISEFADWLVVPGDLGWNTPLNDIWQREGLVEGQGRIIVTYNNGYTDPAMFFPEVLEKWGNKDDPEQLKNYLIDEVENAEGNPYYQPWKPNCQMTPSTEDIILGRWSGLRAMADAVNRNVTAWWRDGDSDCDCDWSDLPATFPIHDFVKSTNMVQESIERNLRMAQKLTLN